MDNWYSYDHWLNNDFCIQYESLVLVKKKCQLLLACHSAAVSVCSLHGVAVAL